MTMLTETEIRPANLQEEAARRYERDLARLLCRSSEFVEVACPACGQQGREPLFQKRSLHYVRCAACATMYVSPRPTENLLAEYYQTSENYKFWSSHIFPASEAARRTKIVVPRVDRLLALCERFEVGRRSFMEIGAGFGTFCEELVSRRSFDRVVAVEPTPSLASSCLSRGLEVIESRCENLPESISEVDALASFEVIEHLFEPRAFVEACRKRLRPGGMLVLTCPNSDGFEIASLGPLSDSVDAEHLNYFNPASLKLLLESMGFRVVEASTPGELDAELVRKQVLLGRMSVVDQPLLQRVLISRWDELGSRFQEFLVDVGFSSHMWIAARRES